MNWVFVRRNGINSVFGWLGPSTGFPGLLNSLWVCVILVFSSCTGYRPQSIYHESLARVTGPDFSFQAFSYLHEGKSRTDVYVGLDNKALQFTKQGEQYIASYNISVRAYRAESREAAEVPDEEKAAAAEISWRETVAEQTYEATSARAFHVSPRSLHLDAGLYTIVAEVTDEVSQRTVRKMRIAEVPDFGSLFLAISDVAIGSRFVKREGKEILVPNVKPEMSTVAEPTYAQFYIYDQLPGREITLRYRAYRVRRYKPPSFLSRYHRSEEVKQLPDTLVWSADSTLTTSLPPISVAKLLPALTVGHYRIEVEARVSEGAAPGGQREAKALQRFSLWPVGFPEIVTLEQQIEVLEYIATPEEFDTLRQAQTKEGRERVLKSFWSTRANREEYYRRAEYANRFFTCLHEGWRTQFGWVYIVAGPPEDIQLTPQGGERWRYTLTSNRVLTIPFFLREFSFWDGTCRTGAAYLEPSIRRELVLQWRKRD
jgi:GWxTD domain-containing protein